MYTLRLRGAWSYVQYMYRALYPHQYILVYVLTCKDTICIGVGVKKFGLELFKRVTNGDCRGKGNLVSGCLGVERSLYDPGGNP
jgi:hypothetical protein